MLRTFTALAFAAVTGGTHLATEYVPELTLKVAVTTTLDVETTKFEMWRDGEPSTPRGGGMESSYERKIEYVDKVLAAQEGKPRKLERVFEELELTRSYRFGENEQSDDLDSPFDGVTVALEIDEEGEVSAKVTDGGDPGKDALAVLRPELPLDALLPGDDKEKGAKWELDNDQVRRALMLDVNQAFFPPKEETEESGGGGGGGRRGMRGRGSSNRLWDIAEWKGTAQFAEIAEHDGVECAVIEITIEAEGDLPEPQGGERRGRGGNAYSPELALAAGNTYEMKGEGKLWFSIADKRPIGLELEGSVQLSSDSERTWNESKVRMVTEQEGDFTYKVSIAKGE